MRFRLPRPRDLAVGLRELARRRPDAAKEYLDTHAEEWGALAESVPQDAADILEAIHDDDAAELIAELDPEEAGDVLDEMRPAPAADLIEELTPAEAARLLEWMTTDQAVDVIGELEEDARRAVLAELTPETALAINRLLVYPPDSAGGLMTTEVAVLPIGLTAGEAIEALRRLHEDLGSNLSYVYVVDDQERLQGVVSFRDLVFARPGHGIDEAMVANPVSVRADTDREIVAELIQRYHLLAIPVLDERNRLLGMVKVSEAMEAAQEEATEDIAAMVGAGAEETVFSPVAASVRRRLPWIVVNLAIGIALAAVIGAFENTIKGTAILAAYMPMVALLGGNSGAQSLAVVIRAMAVGDLPQVNARRVIRREVSVGVLNGLAVAVISATAGGVLTGDLDIGLTIGIAVFLNLMVAGLAGSGIPILLRRLGQDPALASNIFLTMVTDMVGFGGFLLTATLLL